MPKYSSLISVFFGLNIKNRLYEKRTFGQRLIQAIFNIGIPILGTQIWACPNLILSKTETNIKRNSIFLIKSAT